MFCSDMGNRCCTLFRKRRADANSDRDNIVDLREDDLPFPVQCVDDVDENGGTGGVFVDLREDVFPVQCTEQSRSNVARCSYTLAVFLGISLREFNAL